LFSRQPNGGESGLTLSVNDAMVQRSFWQILVGAALVVAAQGGMARAEAPRQWYNDWTYYPQYAYYYSSYYYKPAAGSQGLKFQFCIYYPAHPRYVYYFDPAKRRYWGRLDVKGGPGHQYSLLDPKDRKEKLQDIPESAFPKAGPMPPIPESGDGTLILPVKALPKGGDNAAKRPAAGEK
jgi:hypothetical protein